MENHACTLMPTKDCTVEAKQKDRTFTVFAPYVSLGNTNMEFP
jgi:hypothetical protein